MDPPPLARDDHVAAIVLLIAVLALITRGGTNGIGSPLREARGFARVGRSSSTRGTARSSPVPR
jgi:hypothetical protein